MNYFTRCIALIATLSIALLGHLPAQARMMLSPDGMGQVLHYPYYTVNGGYATLISIVNNSNDAKAVRVRFLEGMNGRIVSEFNLFLGARDGWSGALTLDASSGLAQLLTADKSCTFPALPSGTTLFSRDAIAFDRIDKQVIDDTAARTTVGFVEVIEMGVLVNAELKAAVLPRFDPAFVDASVDYAPKNCGLLNGVYLRESGSSTWSVASAYQAALSRPTGNLSGTGTLINVGQGTDFSYDAVALDGAFSLAMHFAPGYSDDDRASKPSLVDADTAVAILDKGKVYVGQFADGLDAVSSLYQRSAFSNEFTVGQGIGAGTDFVVTMPTRRYYMGKGYPETPRRPFTYPFFPGSQLQEGSDLEMFTPESRTTVASFSLDLLPSASSRYSVTLHTFAQSRVLGPPTSSSLNFLSAGSAKFYFNPQDLRQPVSLGVYRNRISVEETQNRVISTVGVGERADDTPCSMIHLRGLPVIGFAVQKYVNGNVNGVLSNYGGLFQHKYERVIECVQ